MRKRVKKDESSTSSARNWVPAFKWLMIGFALGMAVHNQTLQAQKEMFKTSTTTTTTTKTESEEKQQQSAEPPSYLDLPPATKTVIINVGSNRDPALPKESSGPCAVTIAFEPIIPNEVPPHPQVHVVPAAVSGSASLATMYAYNNNGVSSSLGKAAQDMYWNTGAKNKGMKMVPVIAMKNVLEAIPPHATIEFLKTDTQGFDFHIIKSSIEEIQKRGVQYLMTEVYLDNVITYQGVQNDLCLHWIPFMSSPQQANNAYTLMGLLEGKSFRSTQEVMAMCQQTSHKTQTTGLREADALWMLSSLPDITTTSTEAAIRTLFTYATHNGSPPHFSNEEYQTCYQKQ